MRSALIQSVRQALNQPLLSEARCEAVVRAVLEGIREPTIAMERACVVETGASPRGYRAMIDALTLSLGETE